MGSGIFLIVCGISIAIVGAVLIKNRCFMGIVAVPAGLLFIALGLWHAVIL